MSDKSFKVKRLGILGGTFDPPHNGHLAISKFAIKKLKLTLLLWAVTKKNPLKRSPYINLQKRIELSKKKVGKTKKIRVKSLDKLIKSSKTINLIRYINKYSDSKIFFLMGSDSLTKFHKWDKWREISKLSKIVVFPRSGYFKRSLKCKAMKVLGREKILFMKSKKIDISSSKIRKNYLKYGN